MYAKAFHRPKSFYGRFERKPGDQLTTHYCPGCGHGNLHKFIAEAVDDFRLQDRTVFVSPVGCSVFAYYYFDVGNVQVAHGRAPAAATAIKRALPDSVVISYQGDGDLAAIGAGEIVHAANRGENITVVFVNNAIYGMTGGQMAPTSLLGMKTATTPAGRDLGHEGFPLRVSELLASLEGPTYIERVALHDNKTRMRARKAIRKAILNQVEGRGFSLVEVLAPCPTGWGLEPAQACEWVRDNLTPYFPLGVLRDESSRREGWTRRRAEVPAARLPEILGLTTQAGRAGDAAPRVAPVREARVKVAGFGGQGLLFLGRLLAEAGMRQGYHVSWLPSYGPEMRGGTAHCHVNLSAEAIGSPLVSDPTHLVAMNRPALDKFEREVAAGGLVIYDSSLVDRPPARDDLEVLALPATALADGLGGKHAANMVALGALVGRAGLLDLEALTTVIRATTRNPTLLELNLRAVDAGFAAARAPAPDESLWAV